MKVEVVLLIRALDMFSILVVPQKLGYFFKFRIKFPLIFWSLFNPAEIDPFVIATKW